MDFLMRDQSPLTEQEWDQIDKAVVGVAKRQLVGRRFIEVFGPLGAGMQSVPLETYAGGALGEIAVMGEQDAQPVRAVKRSTVSAPVIFKDFLLHWRDIQATRQLGLPFDTSGAAAASAFCCFREDELVFNGASELGFHGLMTVPDRNVSPRGDWSEPGAGFQSVVAATQKLLSSGFYAPYALVTSPRMYALLHRVYVGGGALEIDHVRRLMDGGVFQSPVLGDDKAVVVALGPQNLDLAVAQDLVTAYLGPDGMDHRFRVLESVVLRIKRPGAICTLEG
ncbi:MAG: family 1 encapsulin nanocompartment shell protein [Armatimonadota bacterium]